MIRIHVRTLSPRPALLSGASVSLLLAELFPFCYPLILAQTLDQLQGKANPIAWDILLLAYLTVVVLHSISLYLRIYLGQRLSIECNHNLRKRVFTHLQRLPIQVIQKTPVGNWMSKVTNDTETYGNIFSEGILELGSNLALLVFSIAFMLVLDWKLALATMVTLPFMIFVSAWFRNQFRYLQARFRESLAGLTGFLQEALNGVEIVQVFRKQNLVYQEYESTNRAYMDLSLRYATRYAGFFPLIQSLSDLSLIACYTAGIWLIASGNISIGMLAAFAWYASIFSRPLRDISDRINSIQTSLAAGDRVREFLALPYEQQEAIPPGRFRKDSDAAIQFEQVHFNYEPGKPVIQGIDFLLRAGSTTALVGTTGCGKSTTLQLLNGFLTPCSGQVGVFGENPCTVSPDTLHKEVAWLSQEPFLFAGSLLENICLGREYDELKFRKVCLQSQIQTLLERLPHGKDTKVGSGGHEISSGQRQLVAYARALYQDPAILLLDEPSSAIDSDTGHKLETALVELMKGRTALIVSHRLSSAMICDRVLVMEAGRIVEEGKPGDLLRLPGSRFSALFRENP